MRKQRPRPQRSQLELAVAPAPRVACLGTASRRSSGAAGGYCWRGKTHQKQTYLPTNWPTARQALSSYDSALRRAHTRRPPQTGRIGTGLIGATRTSRALCWRTELSGAKVTIFRRLFAGGTSQPTQPLRGRSLPRFSWQRHLSDLQAAADPHRLHQGTHHELHPPHPAVGTFHRPC